LRYCFPDKPAIVIGKPNEPILAAIRTVYGATLISSHIELNPRSHDLDPGRTCMIGDTLDTVPGS
jgi:ribonucleotide monophosphatase NagD (HAD superfamily)